eukprot:4640487-Amphidinium_carterae.2
MEGGRDCSCGPGEKLAHGVVFSLWWDGVFSRFFWTLGTCGGVFALWVVGQFFNPVLINATHTGSECWALCLSGSTVAIERQSLGHLDFD